MAEEIIQNETVENQNAEKAPTVEELLAQLAQEKAGRIKAENARDKASSDASDWKKKYRESLSVQQQAEEANKEAEEQHKQYVASLESFKRKAEAKDRYIMQGMDAETALKASDAEVSGDYDLLANIQKTYTETLIKAKEAEWLKSRPQPNAGAGSDDNIDPFLKGFGL